MSKQHITQLDIDAFMQELMSPEDQIKFLEHVGTCDHCSDQFAAMMSEEIISAPRDMKDNILKATRRPEVKLAVKAKETSKRMQLFIYSLKVGTATIGALLLLLLSMNFTDYAAESKAASAITTGLSAADENAVSITKTLRRNMDSISSSMLDFSNTIMNTEVTNND